MKWPTFLRRPTTAELQLESQVLSDEGRTYFNQVLTEYELLPLLAAATVDELALRKVADAIRMKNPEDRTCADLFGLEIAVTKLQTDWSLRRGAWAIRAKYRDLAGEKAYEIYQTSNPPDPKTAAIDELKSDTLQILAEFHWIYAFAPLREKIRSQLTKQVFIMTAALVVTALAIATYGYYRLTIHSDHGPTGVSIPILPVVIAMGMIGGYISLQQRIQTVPATGDPIVNITELSNSQFSVFLSPINGAVFAVVLYIIFIAGLLTGPLFPKISSPIPKCEDTANESTLKYPGVTSLKSPENVAVSVESGNSIPATGKTKTSDTEPCSDTTDFTAFVKRTGPKTGLDFAMLLVWAFIAGFAERFVPDTIDRLISQAAKK
jgi:hypothetical protein